ncbi:MAG: hypothetical protein KKE23_01505 [Nanoarchaeota archaeon]|nr:hypothetical protein [Nanoarchaeota archaeon]
MITKEPCLDFTNSLNDTKRDLKKTLEILCESANKVGMSKKLAAKFIPYSFKAYLTSLDETRVEYGLPKKYTTASWQKYADSLLRNLN